YHWIRYRTNGLWGAWEPLLDPKGDWVNLTGNTSNVIWDISKRPFLQGDLELVGLDLGEYQGRTVQVKFEYHPSGHPETGYVIDDILLIGKETVDTDPFFISSYTREVIPSDPGESVRFNIELVSKLKVTDNDVSVRAEAVEGSDFIDLYRNVEVQPGIIELPKASTIPMLFSINLTLPSSSPSGEGWLKIRVFGSGTFKDVTFRFFVNSRRALELSVDGTVSGMLEPGIPGSLEVTVRNMGNVEELVFLSFLSDTDLVAEGNMDPFSLLPGKSRTSDYNISVPEGSFAGYKNGFILISRSATPSDALDRLLIDDPMPGWSYVELEYFVEYIYDLELIEPSPAATYWEIKDPAQNGTKDVDYHLILENRGNSRDEALFSSPGWTDREDVMLILPENVSIPPGSTMFVNISVRVSYPVPNGIYNFNIQATSLGNEEIKTDIISLTLSVGEAPVSSGIYLVNGSLDLQPSRMVVGQEVVLSFTVRSFGFLDGDTFNVKLWLNNKEVNTKSFPISKYQDKVCQLTWTFDQSGKVNLMISLPDSKKPAHGTSDLVLSLEKEIIVGYIELGITSVNLLVEDGEEVDEGAQPGIYEVLVRVVNNGNTTADIFVVSLIIEEKEQQNGWNLSTNVTDLSPGETRNITFKNIRLQQETSYRFSVLIDNNGRWRETDIDNDQKNLEVEVGPIPPDLPIWRNPVWGIIGFVMTLLMTLGLLFYMLRKKL
ncbi:MAG: CARDB domain-containing protein, partial [Thermoplasmatota archaeon]